MTITGGEPLASHDSFFPVLEHLRTRHVRAQMISNGALVTVRDCCEARAASGSSLVCW